MPGCENWNAVTVTFLTHSSTARSTLHSVPPGIKIKEKRSVYALLQTVNADNLSTILQQPQASIYHIFWNYKSRFLHEIHSLI